MVNLILPVVHFILFVRHNWLLYLAILGAQSSGFASSNFFGVRTQLWERLMATCNQLRGNRPICEKEIDESRKLRS